MLKAKDTMLQNLVDLNERGYKLEQLREKTDEINTDAENFHRYAKKQNQTFLEKYFGMEGSIGYFGI